MQSKPFDFKNARGETLAARLDLPDGTPRAYALMAHCFTCDRNAKGAVRIAQTLTGAGVGMMRFDFTGLGESEGALRGFSADVDDLVAAGKHMAANAGAPELLIGHSLGGAAILAAAGDIPSSKAVATIGAPAEPAHGLRLLGEAGLKAIETDGKAEVSIGGRPFTLDKRFVDDARMTTLADRIHRLNRALLIMHAPTDAIVGIENATTLFLGARHPKSFVSLDSADHLLTKAADADYAAAVIAAWASRYIGAGVDPAAEAPDGAVHVEETGAGRFQVEVAAHGVRLFADEPVAVGGLDSGLSPHELVSAGLGACTCMTVRLYAERKGWPLERVRARVRHDKVVGETPPDLFERKIAFDGPLDDGQRARLYEIADKCPVHRVLEGGARVVTSPLVDEEGALDPAAAETAACDHFEAMDETCRNAGA